MLRIAHLESEKLDHNGVRLLAFLGTLDQSF
jgi:hypothetical protein